jgi:predicted dehydrogenase
VLKTAVVGLGWWGKKIVRDLQGSAHLDVVVGIDPTAEGRAFAEQAGLTSGADLDDALADERVEAVVLCTPHKLHADQIVAAAEAGRHVFCEKPLTTTGEEARRAIAAVRAAGVQLGIGHERRFEPAVQRLREMCRTEELGRPLVFEGNFSQDKFLDLPPDNWRLSTTDAPVGPLSATGIHLVDLAIAILGPPTEVWARLSTQATSFANGDTLTVTLGFADGRTALITAVLTTPFAGRVAVFASAGWTEIRDRSHPEQPQGWDVVTVRRGGSQETEFFPPHPSVLANLESFSRAAQGAEPYPVTLAEMLANVQTFEAITRSAASGRPEAVASPTEV